MGGGGVKGDPQARKSSTSHPDRGAVVEGVVGNEGWWRIAIAKGGSG